MSSNKDFLDQFVVVTDDARGRRDQGERAELDVDEDAVARWIDAKVK